MNKYQDFIGLGIAGNFALHLAQAGELEDFKDVITADEAAPKGIFPFYLPNYSPKSSNIVAKETLATYPLSSTTINLPNKELNIQAEPEVGLICDITYKDKKVVSISPKYFTAYNDCSIRVPGANKISDKKNWGKNSKGISDALLSIENFKENGIMDNYSICSFLRRDEQLVAYGEDVKLTGYSYFYEKLTDWIINQINTQKDFGPLEQLSDYIEDCNYPSKLIISIGATRYTPYGENTFLKSGDEVLVVLYDHTILSPEDINNKLLNKEYTDNNISVLAQKVL